MLALTTTHQPIRLEIDDRDMGRNVKVSCFIAKQRASVKWLLSKAYNNRVPEKLREPYYRDHEDQEHLKPQIVHALSNAELYCLALANIYSDPNYHNQNHTGILQALARKGVVVSEPNSTPLTETILIQNSPLKMSAHMSVIEGLMVLYAKEVITPDRVLATIQRFDPQCKVDAPQDHETGILAWIGHASRALILKIQTEEGGGGTQLQQQQQQNQQQHQTTEKPKYPEIPVVKDFQALCDGVGMAAVVAYYCPGELDWTEIRVSKRSSVADALHNLSLVHTFCVKCLPYPIFQMQPEDVTYMRSSMKQNLVVFLAELYNVLEIHPAKCVRYPGENKAQQYLDACPRNSYGVTHKRSLPQSVTPVIPDLRSNLSVSAPGFTVTKPIVQNTVKKSQSMQQTSESHFNDERRIASEESFVIYRHKGSSTPGSEDRNVKAEAAGRPSNWDENRRSTYAGRRSRRNSISDDSQLTIENFGGSQDNLNNIGRNPDKVGKFFTAEPTLPARSSIQDVYGSGVHSILTDNGHNNDDISNRLKKQKSHLSVSLKNILHSVETESDKDSNKLSSFANLNKSNDKNINIDFGDQNKDDSFGKLNLFNKKIDNNNGNGIVEKKTSFATLPNMTTWQQQSTQQSQQTEKQSSDEKNPILTYSQLNNLRLKLEEKKRHIENEKRRVEVIRSKNRQKVQNEAFLRTVTKGKVKSPSSTNSGEGSAGDISSPSSQNSGTNEEIPSSHNTGIFSHSQQNEQDKLQRPFSLQEITEDVRHVEHKWLDQEIAPFVETRKTPDIENMDLEQYNQSMNQMNTSLSELDADIQRIESQQNQLHQQHLVPQHHQQIQQLSQIHSLSPHHLQSYSISPQNQVISRVQEPQQSQFYLHDQPQVQRRTWGQPQPIHSLTNEIAAVGYQQSLDSRYNSPPIYQTDPRIYHDTRSWGVPYPQQRGFILHDNLQDQRHHNGGEYSLNSNQHLNSYPAAQNLFSPTPPNSASPQHRNAVQRISQLMNENLEVKRSNSQHGSHTSESPVDKRHSSMAYDNLEHQNISYSGNEDDLSQGIKNLNISSGSKTYRIPSPTRPTISRNSFQPHTSLREATPSPSSSKAEIVPLDSSEAEKGFYISFNDTPKKPKPPLRTKRASPKKERSMSAYLDREDYLSRYGSSPINTNTMDRSRLTENQQSFDRDTSKDDDRRNDLHNRTENSEMQTPVVKPRVKKNDATTPRKTNSVGLIIGNDLADLDPESVDEMERKKEKILLLSLQRRQKQEELKEKKEFEAQERREEEKQKEEERTRKKEEEKQRRAAILEDYKRKKAIEEAEREGRPIDKELLNAMKPKLRNKPSTSRPRPKTIHVDAGSELDSGVLTPSRGKKGSSSNLSTASLVSPTMRRDYYRGSQDSLTAAHLDDRRSGSLYRGSSLRVSSVDSPDDGRGSSPSRSTNQLGRRGSYKTSRDIQEPQQQVRGRPKYPSYQNFKGRKSSSMMNLCDTDSGLGRATPPRRAASPGMGSMRHLPSPSGPGSLPPGLMTKRRGFDDNSSDISSTASSMMDYNGPRLYKQPTMKSNRGIMLNAVEYCVFPGTVNKEAKRRVLDEIARSESKHFLILFRDAGCQFRALYSYCPDRDEISKLYGTGPRQVLDKMFDKFFKYNSGGKVFSEVHTKHLTVTIDAFTIHNSLWQGKKVNLPNKKDMALVI